MSPRSPFFFSSRRRHTRYWRDWSSDVCSSDLIYVLLQHNRRCGREHALELFHGRTVVRGRERRAKEIAFGLRITEIGRASCRERVEIAVGAINRKKNSCWTQTMTTALMRVKRS